MPFDLCRIGQLLKTAREEKGLTLDEVSEALFIRKRVMAAIEAGDWETLPHPVYVRGYVTQYASYLKIQDALEEAIMSPLPQPKPVEPEETVLVAAPSRKERASRAWGRKNKIIAAAAVGAVVVGFFVVQNLPRQTYVAPPEQKAENAVQAATTTTTTAAAATTAETTTTAAAATTAAATATSPYPTVEASPGQPVDAGPGQPAGAGAYGKQGERVVLETKKLTIACQEKTWVRIVIDGAQVKEFLLNPEEVVTLDAKEGFDLLIGNAAGVKLIYNGKDVGFTGQAGEVKHINFS